MVIIKIKTGFPKSDDFWVLGQIDQLFCAYLRLSLGVVRMDPDSAKYIIVFLSNG
jgi:hypothetical protein